MGRPKIIFGAATFGMGFDDSHAVSEVLGFLTSQNIHHIDTAGRYPPLKPGLSETLLGQSDAAEKGFVLDTKILAGPGDGSGELSKSAIEQSLATSMQRLKTDSVNILHCHRPDPKTPLVEQASALDELYKQGKFKLLGVSNFPPELLQNFLNICEENGYVKPTVYQGDYNAITRGMEKKLLPILRAHGIIFNAYRPLCSGFLTGKVTAGMASGTRLGDDHPLGKALQGIFKTDETNAAVQKLGQAAGEAGIPIHEAALRWIFCHSVLGESDGVILGASKITQIQSNLESIQRGPLEPSFVNVFDEVWATLEAKRGNII
jgi:aflatoxin B1 aldehyde reductase